MAETNHQQVHPLPQSYDYNTAFNAKRDEESGSIALAEIRRKKRIKYLAYFAAFVVFQTAVILVLSLTVMKVKTPKFRVQSITFHHFEVHTAANPSRFNFIATVEVGVKNKNFGAYKFEDSKMYFSYDNMQFGEAFVPNGKVGWRSSKKLNLSAVLISNNLPSNSNLGNDLKSGVLKLNAQAKLSGKVKLVSMFRKKKSTNLNCNITIGVADRAVRGIECK